MVANGTYRYRVSATDRAGNAKSAELAGIIVDTRSTSVRIISKASGFSPDGDGVKETLTFDIFVGLTEGIKSCNVAAFNTSTRTSLPVGRGTGGNIPREITWKGTDGTGKTAAEGSCYAVLTVEYEKGNLAQERSAEFLLDISPPETSLTIAPLPFSPDDDGENDLVNITLTATDKSPLEDWEIRILDPMENLFTEFSGTGAPVKPIIWNGKSPSGELVQAASDYNVQFRVRDTLGNTARGSKVLPVDVYVIRDGDLLRIRISSISFAPFSTEFQPGKEEENRATLRRLAEILKKYGQYRITIEGHAVRIYWFNEERGRIEEREVLLPLSSNRAEVVKKALIELGIAESRTSTARFGGTRPVVPHSDLDNRPALRTGAPFHYG